LFDFRLLQQYRPEADIAAETADVRFWGRSGQACPAGDVAF